MLTISIMPSRRPSVFQSTARHRLVLVQHADQDQQPGAEQRDDRAVELVAHDDDVRDDEERRRHPQRRQAEDHATRRARSPCISASLRAAARSSTSRADTMPTSRPLSRSTTGMLFAPLVQQQHDFERRRVRVHDMVGHHDVNSRTGSLVDFAHLFAQLPERVRHEREIRHAVAEERRLRAAAPRAAGRA